MKFKIGDKVRAIEGSFSGRTGIIGRIDEDCPFGIPYAVNFSGIIGWKMEKYLELISEDEISTLPKPLGIKDTNPKDAVGVKKWRQFSTIPFTIIWELGVAMLEGARKYGRHNYRAAGIRASVYIDAAMGHLSQWWEGEDTDKDSQLNHITKAMACLAVLRDGMINEIYVDDRPPKVLLDKQRDELQKAVDGIFEKYPDAVEPYTENNQGTRW